MSEELAVPISNYRVKISVILTVVKILFSLQNGKRIGTRRYATLKLFLAEIKRLKPQSLRQLRSVRYAQDTLPSSAYSFAILK